MTGVARSGQAVAAVAGRGLSEGLGFTVAGACRTSGLQTLHRAYPRHAHT